MKAETLIDLLKEMAGLVDRPGGCEGGGAILQMAAAELERLKWLARHPDIQRDVPTTP